MILEYANEPQIARLLQNYYGYTHKELKEQHMSVAPPEKDNIFAVKQAMLYASHLQAEENETSITNDSIPFLTIKSLSLPSFILTPLRNATNAKKVAAYLDENLKDICTGEGIVQPRQFICSLIVYYSQQGIQSLAQGLQAHYRISNREMMELCERSSGLAFLNNKLQLSQDLAKAQKHFASLYQKKLAQANFAKINREIMDIDAESPSAEKQYRRSVLADYKAEIVQYREKHGLGLEDSNFRELKGMRLSTLEFYTTAMQSVAIANKKAFTSKDLSAISNEVSTRKADKTDLLFLVNFIAECYLSKQYTLAKQLQKKYRISDAEMALVFQNSADAITVGRKNANIVFQYEYFSKILNPDPVFTKIAVDQVKIDLDIGINASVLDILKTSLPNSKNFSTVMNAVGGINTDLPKLCSLIAYCELQGQQQKNATYTAWANDLRVKYGITDAMMLLVSIQSKDNKPKALYNELKNLYIGKCKGVEELLIPLQTWLDTNKANKVQQALVSAFRNEVIKLYQDPSRFPTEKQIALLKVMAVKLIDYYEKEQELLTKQSAKDTSGYFAQYTDVKQLQKDFQALKNELLNLNEKLYHAGRTPRQKAKGMFLRGITILGGLVLLAIGVALMAAAIVSLIAAFGPAGILGTGAAAVFLNSLIGGVGTTAIASIVAGEATAATVLPALAVVGGAAFVGTHGAASTYAAAVLPIYSSHKFFQPAQAAEKVSGLVKEKLISPKGR